MSRRAIIAGLFLILIGSGAVFFTARALSAEKVLYLAADDIGPDPFTEPAIFTSDVQPVVTTTTTTTTTPPPSPSPGATPSPSAAAAAETTTTSTLPPPIPVEPPVSYGSKGDCDPEKLIAFLNENPEVEQAWVEILGVDIADFENYVRTLQPTVLDRDTRITAHGFKDGKAYPYQAILTEGTAVLVDPNGEIVTRCICGNPLIEPRQIKYKCNGCPDNYQPPPPCEQTCYQPPTTTSTSTTIVETTTGETLATTTTRRGGTTTRPSGGTTRPGSGGTTRPGSGGTTTRPVTTTAPTTTAPTTTAPATTTTGLCILPGVCIPTN